MIHWYITYNVVHYLVDLQVVSITSLNYYLMFSANIYQILFGIIFFLIDPGVVKENSSTDERKCFRCDSLVCVRAGHCSS